MLIAVTFVMHAVFLGERCIARHLFQIWKNMIFIFFFPFPQLISHSASACEAYSTASGVFSSL